VKRNVPGTRSKKLIPGSIDRLARRACGLLRAIEKGKVEETREKGK
jgi:hypothetical protein